MKKYKLILAFIIGAILVHAPIFGQSSLYRMKSVNSFGWNQRVVPNAAYLDSTFNGFWLRAGNTVGNNTSYIGTNDNRSFYIKTNNSNSHKFKVDSFGYCTIVADTNGLGAPASQSALSIIGSYQNNAYMSLNCDNISAYRIKHRSTGKEWFLQNQTYGGGVCGLDGIGLGVSSNPASSFLALTKRGSLSVQTYSSNVLGSRFLIDTLGNSSFLSRLKIGSITLPTTSSATLDVVGTLNVSSTATLGTTLVNALNSTNYVNIGPASFYDIGNGEARIYGKSYGLSFRGYNPMSTVVEEKFAFQSDRRKTGANYSFSFTPTSFTAQTASTDAPIYVVGSATVGHATGALTTANGLLWSAQTHSFIGASTITDCYASFFNKSIAGSNATITRNWGIGTDGSALITKSCVIGAAAKTPVATLDVSGSMSVSSTATVNGNTNIGGYLSISSFVNTSSDLIASGNVQVGTRLIPTAAANLTISTRAASSNDIIFCANTSTANSLETMRLTSAGVMSVTGTMIVSGTSTLSNLGSSMIGTSQIAGVLTGSGTLDFSSTSAQSNSDLTITVTGAAVGDPVSLAVPATMLDGVSYFAWVTSANTVTVRLNNYSSSAKDPASGTFKATVIKN